MTVITTIISKQCCVHGTDSYICEKLEKSIEFSKLQFTQPKIVPVRKFKGALSYWGLAKANDWFMYDWLKEQVRDISSIRTPEEFANSLADKLNNKLSRFTFESETQKGLGIHFSSYENINGEPIPELFVIRNFDGTNYRKIMPNVVVTRETIPFINKMTQVETMDESSPHARNRVIDFLNMNGIFIFNNGDPSLFNSAAYSILNMLSVAKRRQALNAPNNVNTYEKMAKWSVNQVIRFQKKFYKKGQAIVGGKVHTISITPKGDFSSITTKVLR